MEQQLLIIRYVQQLKNGKRVFYEAEKWIDRMDDLDLYLDDKSSSVWQDVFKFMNELGFYPSDRNEDNYFENIYLDRDFEVGGTVKTMLDSIQVFYDVKEYAVLY